MALHTRDVQARSGDYMGPVLLYLQRLLAAGHGGQILCSEETATLLRREVEPGIRLVDLGVYRLRETGGAGVGQPQGQAAGRLDAGGRSVGVGARSPAPPAPEGAVSDTPERLFQVEYPEMAPGDFPPLQAEPARHLPPQLTRFFGREEAIARLRELLSGPETRLVTVTGPGGSG
jgi:hypothetical protein